MRQREQGFTLVEVMVVLVVASLLTLLAHSVFGAAIEAGRALVSSRRSIDQTNNAYRFLTGAFLSLDVGAVAEPFEGDTDAVRFATWLETPEGWFEPTVTEIRLDRHRLVASVDTKPPIVLADSIAAVRFDYLLEPGADAVWIAKWVSPLSAPIGIRMRVYHLTDRRRVSGDTMLFQIKARK